MSPASNNPRRQEPYNDLETGKGLKEDPHIFEFWATSKRKKRSCNFWHVADLRPWTLEWAWGPCWTLIPLRLTPTRAPLPRWQMSYFKAHPPSESDSLVWWVGHRSLSDYTDTRFVSCGYRCVLHAPQIVWACVCHALAPLVFTPGHPCLHSRGRILAAVCSPASHGNFLSCRK